VASDPAKPPSPRSGGLRVGPWLVAAAVVVAAGFALWGTAPPPPLTRGSKAPEFALPVLDGQQPLDLASLRGKVVLLNFWATWCKPCEDEMPAMQRLHAALSGDAFELVAVSVDSGDAEVRAFRDRLALSFPILLDPQKEISRRYQTFRYPESFLIGRDGVVIERYVGPRSWDEPLYVQRIRELIGATAAPGA
jgi:cytochrome c biogenesis protein CcmG, thiol:disulfide interchange protein DsbE